MVWEPTGWLNKAGVLDYAGGTVVHNAGVAGLASCLVLGKRLGYGREAMAPITHPDADRCFALMGGWFGFMQVRGSRDGRAHGDAGDADATAAAGARLGVREWVSRASPASWHRFRRGRAWSPSRRLGFVGPTPAVSHRIVAGVLCFIAATL